MRKHKVSISDSNSNKITKLIGRLNFTGKDQVLGSLGWLR